MAKSKRTKRIDAWVRRNQGEWVCACCGLDIEILRKHYSTGVPNFIKGHNMHGGYNPKTENMKYEEESLWDSLPKEEKERRLSQLKSFPRGEDHPNWSGGSYITDGGYENVLVNDHPYTVGGYLAGHRLVVEKWMRANSPTHRFMEDVDGVYVLKRVVVVHHRNRVRLDNHIENLIILETQAHHAKWHSELDKRENGYDLDLITTFRDHIFCPWVKDDDA